MSRLDISAANGNVACNVQLCGETLLCMQVPCGTSARAGKVGYADAVTTIYVNDHEMSPLNVENSKI